MRQSRILKYSNLNLKHQNFVKPTLETFAVFKNIFKWSAVFSLAGLLGTLATFEGVNQFVEYKRLEGAALYNHPPPNDTDEWSLENDDWSGGLNGGTHPSIPYKPAHLVRSAWIALEWGVGTATNITSLNPSLDMAQSYLLSAITHIQAAPATIHKDYILNTLSLRLADIRSRIHTRVSLHNALDGYEKVVSFLVASGAPPTALIKVENSAGNVCRALGLHKESESWYHTALRRLPHHDTPQSHSSRWPSWLTLTRNTTHTHPRLDVNIASLSPAQLRAYIETLLSLSKLYSTTTRLTEASSIQKTLIDVLHRSTDPHNTPHCLQALWLRHSLALSQVHYAEVRYALNKSNLEESLGWLQNAENLSQTTHKAVDGSFASDTYAKRQALKLTASSNKTASECAYLMGVLHQSVNDNQRALGCFERAIKSALHLDSLTKQHLESLPNDPANLKYIDAYKNIGN
ncbi:hypothetical protein E3P98_00398 [Wallemia ichthyophaga]|nr:hypothetical protein E3P98_00398 [Wallemia ichthyophaga]